MKNSIVILFLLLLSQFGYAQGRTFKVTARPWVKGQKNLPWKEYDTRTIAQLDGFKPTGKVRVNKYGSDLDSAVYKKVLSGDVECLKKITVKLQLNICLYLQ